LLIVKNRFWLPGRFCRAVWHGQKSWNGVDDLIGYGRFAGLAGLVMQQPVDPASMKQRCQRQTQSLDTPARRITSVLRAQHLAPDRSDD
jgi:hypothetical protein